jgi:glycerol-3-phosphate dehydrogenase
MTGADFGAFRDELRKAYPRLPATLLDRLAAAYGTRVDRLLGVARSTRELGEEVLPGLHQREIEYLRSDEWAVTAEDILYRRSKLALHLPADAAARLDDWLARHPRSDSSRPALV